MRFVAKITSYIIALVVVLAGSFAVNATEPLVGINDVKSGSLLFATQIQGRHVPAPLLATDVDIAVSGPIARVRVRQTFLNPSRHWLEGRYVFPLPHRAAVHRMTMRSRDREIVAEIREKQAARALYDQARQSGRRAALIEQHRPNIFTTDVANLGPGETIDVEISYLERLRYDQGDFRLRFPMVVAPRFTPQRAIQTVKAAPADLSGNDGAGDTLPKPPVRHPDEGKLNPVKLVIRLDAGVPLATLKSPHHRITASDWQDGKSDIALAGGVVPADRDFELIWTPTPSASPVLGLFRETIGDENFLLAMILPPAPYQAPPPVPRDVIFVLDRSGSMAGASIRQARKALVFALRRLTQVDRFNILRFDNNTDRLFDGLQAVTEKTIERAVGFVEDTEARGGTDMRPALLAALSGPSPADRLRQIIFLTDAAISNEAALFDAIAARIGQNRLFTVGIGSAPNSYFMQRAAELGRGSFTYIGNTQKVGEVMRALFRKIERPMATSLSLKWTGLLSDSQRIDVYPGRLPDLYGGEPVVVAARIKGPDTHRQNASLEISGDIGGKPWQRTVDLQSADPVEGAGTIWGRARIAYLMASRHRGADPASIKRAVTATALRHHIVSRYTSLVAFEKTVARPVDEPVYVRPLPRNLPDGWDFEKVFGGVLKTRNALHTLISVPPAAVPAPPPNTATKIRRGAPANQIARATGNPVRLAGSPGSLIAQARTVRLPAGSTSAAINLIVGIVALIIGVVLMRRKRAS